MRYALFSDLHDAVDGLLAVEADAQRRHADKLVSLGDVGHDPALYTLLQQRGYPCIYGNWEVSRLHRLPAALANWAATWPGALAVGDVVFCHATPDQPPAAATAAGTIAHMGRGVRWHHLFPSLHTQEAARWQALAQLESKGQIAAFHGHTHIQHVWRYGARGWRGFDGPVEFSLASSLNDPAPRFLIGVGSAGAPQDGTRLRYAIYDDVQRMVRLVALG
jgi:hypothetical protein